MFLVTTPFSSCLLRNTHLVPTIFWLGRGTKCHTSFLMKLLSSSCIANTQSESLNASSTLYGSIEDTKESNVHKNGQHEIEWLPPYEYRRGWSSRGDLVVLLGGLLGEAALDPHCWGLVLKCYELRTRQHKMLSIKAFRPSKHYFPLDIMDFGRRL